MAKAQTKAGRVAGGWHAAAGGGMLPRPGTMASHRLEAFLAGALPFGGIGASGMGRFGDDTDCPRPKQWM